MAWETLFTLTNLWAMLSWALLVFAPRKPAVMSAVLFLGVALLCLAYAIMLGLLMSGSVDAGGPSGGMDFTTLAGVMALFDSKGGAVIGWTHYLAFDLFVGLWIARDADAKRIGRLWQSAVLVLTLLVGPVGLFLWLVIREPRARAAARAR